MAARAITDAMRKQVEALSGYGLTDAQMAPVIGVSEATLKRRFRTELTSGRAKALAAVAQSLYRQAVSGRCVAASIFYMKVRAGWSERIEHTGRDGAPIEVKDAAAQFLARVARATGAAPGQPADGNAG